MSLPMGLPQHEELTEAAEGLGAHMLHGESTLEQTPLMWL